MSDPPSEKQILEESMESKTLQKFNHSIEGILYDTQDMDLNTQSGDLDSSSAEYVRINHRLLAMSAEAAKLKILGYMEYILPEHLVRLLQVLENIIAQGINISLLAESEFVDEDCELNKKLDRRVLSAVNASLLSLHIMTSPKMSKVIYLEGTIDKIISFIKFQLHCTIYPSFDQVYGCKKKGEFSEEKNKNLHTNAKKKNITILYTKLNEVISLLTDLLNVQVLTDIHVFGVISFCLPSFFIEGINDLQLSTLKLITMIFSRYEQHRGMILDDILVSISRSQNDKRFKQTYHLSSDTNISVFSALILHITQSAISFPDGVSVNEEEKSIDELILNKYEAARRVITKFLPAFISVCLRKNEGMDNRQLFENFVSDILKSLNNPEWPVTEMIVLNLTTILVKFFMNKDSAISLRTTSLEYFGVIVARLRKDALSLQSKLGSIGKIADKIRELNLIEELDDPKKKKPKLQEASNSLELEEEQTHLLLQSLLCYLSENGLNDLTSCFAKHFCIVQWYLDAHISTPKLEMKSKPIQKELPKVKKQSKKKKKCITRKEKSSVSDANEKDSIMLPPEEERNLKIFNLIKKRKRFLIGEIRPLEIPVTYGNKSSDSPSHIGNEDAELISCYFSSKRPFHQIFNIHLKQILYVLTERNITIRTKALKCLAMIVEVDSTVLGKSDMLLGVQYSFSDYSASVREAVIDVIGKHVLQKLEFIDKYYDILSARIMDSSITVRKRIIRIFCQICILYPEFPKIPDIWIKMIRRINDEEGVKNLVLTHFQNVWFSPIQETSPLNSQTLVRKVINMTDFVGSCQELELNQFEQLLSSLLKPKEEKCKSAELPKLLLSACHQIVDCLIENVLKLEETDFMEDDEIAKKSEDGVQHKSQNYSHRFSACFLTLYLFAKTRPQLLVDHAITLLPYLSIKCQNQDNQIISNVAKIFELVVPLMEHPSDVFLAQLEEDLMKAVLRDNKVVISSCLSCMSSTVNYATHNYKLISDCFSKYYDHLTSYKLLHETEPSDPSLIKSKPFSRRAMYTIGLFLKHFDFTKEEVRNDLPENIKDQVLESLMYFACQPDQDLQSFAIQAIGSLCMRHTECFLGIELKSLYMNLLSNTNSSPFIKIQVLSNIKNYLLEEEKRNSKQLHEWDRNSKEESIKEMNDVSSGMASTVIQLYLKEILESFFHSSEAVRHAVLRVVNLVFRQGLVHPAQILPCLISMSTEADIIISHSAKNMLQDIETKYRGFLQMKSMEGVSLSYKFQKLIQEDVVRGHRIQDGSCRALIGLFYSILRSKKQQRRAILVSILKQFDEPVKITLSEMLYLADNLALLPYCTLDEPLFLIHHIDLIIGASGLSLLQDFQEAFLPLKISEKEMDYKETAEEKSFDEKRNSNSRKSCSSTNSHLKDTEDKSSLMARIPEDTTELQRCVTISQGYMLLLLLREHIKDAYSIKEGKIFDYSPSKPNMIYEKAVNQQHITAFNPKVILKTLKEQASTEESDEKARKSIIQKYLKFKEFILCFEKSDSDEEDGDITVSSMQTSQNSSLVTDSHSLSMEKESDTSLDTTANISLNCESSTES